MSIKKEPYSFDPTHCKLTYNFTLSCLPTDSELLATLESIMTDVFEAAEDELEKELYYKGLMMCNEYIENIDYMRVNGNSSVQEYIKYLDETYKG